MTIGKFTKSIKVAYHKAISSIAFYPAVIAIGFLILSWLMLELDFSETGKFIKATYSWVRLKDASTARTIVSTISAGIISLMVFSFSMVMILLNQAASQMSNRMLESMIGNRFQQYVLGMYIGTIVYSLFLLSTIRDIESGIYVPALSIYLLLIITVIDVFVFIYFLHYVTQSVKFETIIERVHQQTLASLKNTLVEKNPESRFYTLPDTNPEIVGAKASGYFQGFDTKAMLKYTCENNVIVKLLHPPGTYLLQRQPIIEIYNSAPVTKENLEAIDFALDFYPGQPVGHNFYYGFHQLAEVALKALSPGINDPETAVLSINALADLFYYTLHNHQVPVIEDTAGKPRIFLYCRCFQSLFTECIVPIWNYGSKDYYIQNTFKRMITELQKSALTASDSAFLNKFLEEVERSTIKN